MATLQFSNTAEFFGVLSHHRQLVECQSCVDHWVHAKIYVEQSKRP